MQLNNFFCLYCSIDSSVQEAPVLRCQQSLILESWLELSCPLFININHVPIIFVLRVPNGFLLRRKGYQ